MCLLIVCRKRGSMSEERNTQWHPAFCSTVRLELREDAQYLKYMNEYTLNTKPLQMDLLVIKKVKDIELKNEIGKIFKTHNIMEYKSPLDSLNLSTYLKVVAYALLYKTQEEHVDDIELDQITITLVRERKPKKLFSWFEDNGYRITQKYPGIYYIEKEGHFLTQILVSCELSKTNQKWLTLLTRDLDESDVARVVSQMEELSPEEKANYGDSVLQVAMKENKAIFSKVKEEDGKMCEALRELMEPELKEAKELGRQQGIRQGVCDTINKFFKAGNSVADIARIMQVPVDEVEKIVNGSR